MSASDDSGDAHADLAIAYFEMGLIEDAVREICAALTLYPDNERLRRLAEDPRCQEAFGGPDRTLH